MFSRGGSALVAVVLMAVATVPVRAQGGPGPSAPDTLASYRFAGAAGSEATVAPSRQQVYTTSTPMRRGSSVAPAAAANAFGASSWSTAGVLDTAGYFSFRTRAYVGYACVITSIGLRGQRSLTGPRHLEIRSSVDGFTSSLLNAAVPDDDSTRRWNVSLSRVAPFDSLLNDVEFRIYGYDAEAGAGTWLIDNVLLYGFILNDGATRPAMQFTNATQTAAEATTTLNIPVFVTDANLRTMNVQVELAPIPGTATVGADFTFAPQTLTFQSGGGGPGGVFLQMVTLNLLDDALPEADETIQLQLTNVSTGSLFGNPSIITVTIPANDGGVTPRTPLTPIASARPLNSQAIPTRSGQRVRLRGIVAAPNLRGTNGYQTTLIDASSGIGLLRTSALGTQTMTEGDSLEVVGIVSQYNGLTQIAVDSFATLLTSQPLPVTPRSVTMLDETTESVLVRLSVPVWLVNPLQWTNTSPGFTVDVTDGTSTYAMRIARGTTVFNTPAPTSWFVLTGIGGQYDPTAPYTTGYQIMPRSLADIQAVVGIASDAPRTAQGLTLFPNPTADVLTLEAADANAPVTVLDASGRVVLQAPANTPALRVGALPAGIYAVRVGAQVRRFVKQ